MAKHAIDHGVQSTILYVEALIDALVEEADEAPTRDPYLDLFMGEGTAWVVRLVRAAQRARTDERKWQSELIEIAEELYGTQEPS